MRSPAFVVLMHPSLNKTVNIFADNIFQYDFWRYFADNILQYNFWNDW